MHVYRGIIGLMGGKLYTGTLADDYITARNVTNSAMQGYLRQLEADLFAAGLINSDGSSNGKIKGLWLYGGPDANTAAGHKYNFLNAVDSDAAFRDTYNGGLTHGSTGITGSVVDGYINSHFTKADYPGTNDAHMMIYCRNDRADAAEAFYGAIDSSFNGTRHLPRLSSASYKSVNSSTGAGIANTVTSGLWVHTRTGSSADVVLRNGSVFHTQNYASNAGTSNRSILGLAVDYNNGASIYQNSGANICARSFGGGLTNSEAIAYSNALNTYFTSLGLNIY